jgi:uncharacterized protein (TIGR02001 family)
MKSKLSCLLYVALSTFAATNANADQASEHGAAEGMVEYGPAKAAKQSIDVAQYLDGDEFLGGKFSTWIELASDYVYRGTSETRDGKIPSTKVAITWTHSNGLYLGLYSANNLFPGSGPRNDNPNINALWGPYIGYSTKDIAGTGINYNGMVFQYMYPASGKNNYAEMFNYFDKQYGKWNLKVEFTPTISDWFGVKNLHSYNAAFLPSYSLPYGITLSGGIGYQWFKNDGPKIDYNGDGHQDLNWLHWNVGINRKVFGYLVDLRYHDTNIKKGEHDLYGNTDQSWDTVNQRLVIAVSKSF